MSFARWLRTNSEHYLLIAAQDRIARQYGTQPPPGPHGARECVLAAHLRADVSTAALVVAAQGHAHDARQPPPDVGATTEGVRLGRAIAPAE